MTERWRPVVGWEGVYDVSDLGRVWSRARIVPYPDGRRSRFQPARILRPAPGTTGYPTVELRCHPRKGKGRVHVMVLEAFVGPRPPGHECRHLNGDRADNRLENLSWGTNAENTQDRIAHGRAARGLTLDDVALIRAAVSDGWTDTRIAALIGVTRRSVSLVRLGITWSHTEIDPERHAAAVARLRDATGMVA